MIVQVTVELMLSTVRRGSNFVYKLRRITILYFPVTNFQRITLQFLNSRWQLILVLPLSVPSLLELVFSFLENLTFKHFKEMAALDR